jgi:hypothetical protein
MIILKALPDGMIAAVMYRGNELQSSEKGIIEFKHYRGTKA